FLVRVNDLQRDGVGRRLEKIINDGADGRILSGWLLRGKWGAREGIIVDPNCRRRTVKPESIPLRGIGSLPQRSDVVQNPERAAVRCNNQILTVNCKIANGGDRK